MTKTSLLHRLASGHAVALTLLGTSFFAGSAGLTAAHVLKIRAMRDIGFPIAADVQPLLQRKALLEEQSEVAQLQASARGSSYREIYDLYVLPEKPDSARTVATLESLLTQLQDKDIVESIDGIETGATDDTAADVTVRVTVRDGSAQPFLDLFDLSGVLTVNDAFTQGERNALLAMTERESPAAIAAVEQFLGGDLLQYAKVPQLAESQLLKSVGTDQFEASFRSLVDSSRLRAFAQTALLLEGGEQSLWPLPLFTVERAHWETSDGGEKLTVLLRAHAKPRS